MLYYLYDEYAHHYIGVRDEDQQPPFSTAIAPLPFRKQMYSSWHSDEMTWKYHEMGETNPNIAYMNELLDYATIRVIEYPPKEDYLDAVVKNDEQQMSMYIQSCQNVKAKWPKDMVPITRREYSIIALGMIPWNPQPILNV
jgi:hypothetical protein